MTEEFFKSYAWRIPCELNPEEKALLIKTSAELLSSTLLLIAKVGQAGSIVLVSTSRQILMI